MVVMVVAWAVTSFARLAQRLLATIRDFYIFPECCAKLGWVYGARETICTPTAGTRVVPKEGGFGNKPD